MVRPAFEKVARSTGVLKKEMEMKVATRMGVTAVRQAVTVFATLGLFAAFCGSQAFSQSAARLEIQTLSSRPDLVSGGDALIEVKTPTGTQLSQLTLILNGKDVTSQLKNEPGNGNFRGVISGLTIGENSLHLMLKASRMPAARLTLKNYPITGPILSGPHLTP